MNTPNFILLPSDPGTRLTPEQRAALAAVLDLKPLVAAMPLDETNCKPSVSTFPSTAQDGR